MTRRILALLAAAQVRGQGKHVAVGGARLWVRDSGGRGAPVVLLHAATGSTGVWDGQFAAFGEAGFRVIAYDRRGYGRTEAEGGAAGAVDDLVALLDQLRVGRIHLLGTAAGGGVALDFALSYPKRLRSLVIANSLGGVQDSDYVATMRRIRPQPQFDALPVEFRELGPSYRAANPEGTRRWTELARNRITFTALELIRVPVLLLTGDADLYTQPAVLRLFAARMRGAETAIVPEAGHSAYWEDAEFFNRRVIAFLRKHGS